MNISSVVVMGAGPAGYAAAIRAAQLGMKATLIEERGGDAPVLGGTCLNVGCIPSKALLDSSHLMSEFMHAAEHGVIAQEPQMVVPAMQQRKEAVVDKLTSGVSQLCQANSVTVVHGRAELGAEKSVTVTAADGSTQTLTADAVIIASGSDPVVLKGFEPDGQHILDSTGALDLQEVPHRLVVIGAGAIGLELGSVWRRLGADVTILEALDTFMPMVDERIARDAQRELKKQGLDIQLGARVTEAAMGGAGFMVHYERNGQSFTQECDKLIVAVGRKPRTDCIGSDSGVTLTDRGFVTVDGNGQTSVSGVYAIGDVAGGAMLAHKATQEAVCLVERLNGRASCVNYDLIASVVYTHPEIAFVGLGEKQAKAQGMSVNVGSFGFAANGRALAAGDAVGMVRVIADSETDALVGVHVFGPGASEIVQQAVIGMEFGATAEDFGAMTFAHPGLSEALHEASLDVHGEALHAVSKKRNKGS